MKLTNKQLRQIIKEELDAVLNEASGFYVVQFTKEGVTVNDQNGPVMTVMKGQFPYYDQIKKAAGGDAEGMRGLKRQIAEKTGNENISDNDIKFNTMNEAASHYVVRFTDRGVEVNDQNGPVMMVTKGQREYYNPIAGAQRGDQRAMQNLLSQLSKKVGHQVTEKDISIQS